MKKDDVSRLLQRYLSACREGKDPYFDADEIEDLLDSFEESDDYTYYDEVLALGLKLHPSSEELKIRQCRQLVYNEDFAGALTMIDNIAETDNQDLDMLRLECYASRKEYAKVIEFMETLRSRECEYLEELFEYIAPILNDMEMQEEARDFIDRGLLMFPDNLILKDELCFNLEMSDQIGRAIEVCNELIDKNPYSCDFWFTLGRLYSMSAEYDKAIEAFDFALTCDDSDVELKMLKAYCLYMNESYEKAIEVYNEIADEEVVRDRIKPFMAECFIKLDNFEKGYELLRDMLSETYPDYEPSAYINLIRCCLETGHEEEVEVILRKATKLFPDNIRLLSLMALSQMDNGQEEEAMQTTDRIFEILDRPDENKDTDDESLFRAGQYLYTKGDMDKALKFYTKVWELNPERPFIHIHLAMAYLAKGDLKKFGEHFRQTSAQEMMEYLKASGIDADQMAEKLPISEKFIPPEDLVKEFLKNKDNSN